MNIETSVNLSGQSVNTLKETAGRLGISVSRLVSILIMIVLRSQEEIIILKRVKYQKRLLDDKWKTLHLYLRSDVYESSLDLKKVMKMSVSFIIATAIEKYLDEIVNKLKQKENTDNYMLPYIFILKIIDEIQYIIIIRGIPTPQHLQKLKL